MNKEELERRAEYETKAAFERWRDHRGTALECMSVAVHPLIERIAELEAYAPAIAELEDLRDRLGRERDEALADLSNTEAARAAAEHAAARAEERCRIAEARAARFKAGLEALCWMAVEAAS